LTGDLKLNIYFICIMGEGGYGVVARIVNIDTEEVVALKVMKEFNEDNEAEVECLCKLRQLDADKHKLGKFIEHFEYKDQFCLTFEILDLSLRDFLSMGQSLHVTDLRVVAGQMLVALEALKSIGLVPTDIKPDNIMFVHHRSEALKVKLIDCDCATEVSELAEFDTIQAVGYRAPEVILGLPMTEAVDMWALGAVLATLFIGDRNFYPTGSVYEQLRIIVHMQGQPKDHLLKAGQKVRHAWLRGGDLMIFI
uniref:Protein kinase domain-containing protein n=1 Tax=Amphiprion percula TaxID=161767 RepID=A0A3P8TXM8_AMPPE